MQEQNMQASSSAAAAVKTPTTTSSTSSTVSQRQSIAKTATAVITEADSNCEIAEISKKISEHADAIYRTWKCRGLAPTELLDFYTSAAAAESTAAIAPDFLGTGKVAVTDEVTSTEGLQQLVKSFVIKDKQQRSAKVSNINVGRMSSSNIKKSPILATTATSADGVLLKSAKTASGTMKQTKPVTQRPSAILLPETTSATATTTTTTTTAKTTAPTAVKLNDEKTPTREAVAAIAAATAATAAARRNGCASGKRHQETTATAIAKTKTASKLNSSSSSNKFARDILDPQSLNLDLGLGLDLNDLTKLQTENLLKIKELLQQESVAAAADASAGDKPKKAATKTATTSKTVTNFTGNNKKRSENMVATPAAASAAATTPLRNTATSSTRDDNVKSPVTSNADGDEAVVVVVVADKNSNCTKKSNTSAATATATPTIIAANKSLLSEQLIASASSSSNVSENKNKIKSEEKSVKNKVIKGSSISSRINSSSNSSSNNRNNSSSSNNKILREKSVASVKNTSKGSAIPTAITATPTATTTSNAATTPASATSKSLTAAAENITEAARTSMPAPAKVKLSRPLTNGQDKNLGRPILTRGSVAERVLMFEKCPDVRNSFLNIKRPDPADAPPRSVLKIKLHSTPPPPPEQNSLQKEIRTSGKSVYIPRFYFPHGKPQPQIAIERTLRGILSAFDSFPNNQVTKDELPRILKLCGLPFYWRMPVMIFCQHGQSGLVERQRFVEFWKQMNVYCHDNASRFVYILSRGQRFRSYILPEDLAPLVQDVVDTHPGLAFLKEATEFHSRYVHTVIARIFYAVNRSWSGKISIAELKKSDLLEIITLLEEEDDINQIMAFFSYEHFYVIYCKFWELDRDHDLLINQEDLSRYSDHALSTRITERIFSGCVTRVDTKKDPDEEPKMSYTDFVWFLLSEEDKRTPTAIEYWFRCMDVDGDGVLSMYELEYFYEEQQQRMESIGLETLPFEDCLCQMLDMIKPQNRDRITLGDLKRCKMTHVFFDTFFNLEKYLDHEQRDPFASQRDEYTSDWDRFAAQEYELLITEEND